MEQWEEYVEVDHDKEQDAEEASMLARMRRNKASLADKRAPCDRQIAFVEFKAQPEA